MKRWLLDLSDPMARRFASVSLLLSLSYAVLNPPLGVNDEEWHLPRIEELSRGKLLTWSRSRRRPQWHVAPAGYQRLRDHYWTLSRDRQQRLSFAHLKADLTAPRSRKTAGLLGRAGSYTPVAYAPHIVAVWLARNLNLPVLWDLYLARFASALGYTALATAAVTVSGRLGWLFFVLGLTPVALTQAGGVSGDGMTNGLAFLYFALIAKGTVLATPLSRSERRALVACVVLATLCKPVYLLLALAAFALPSEGAHTPRWRLGALTLVIAGTALGAWTYRNRHLHSPETDHPLEQVDWMLTHPLDAVGAGGSSRDLRRASTKLASSSKGRRPVSASYRHVPSA